MSCPAGYYCTDGEIPLLCSRGRYCPGNTTIDQPMCPRGTFNSELGKSYVKVLLTVYGNVRRGKTDGLYIKGWPKTDGLYVRGWPKTDGLYVRGWPKTDGLCVRGWPKTDGLCVRGWPKTDGLCVRGWPKTHGLCIRGWPKQMGCV